MTDNFRNVTDDELGQTIAANKTVIVDVWAEWCGPCKMLLPLVEKLAAETPDVQFVKLNADTTELMAELQVRGVPTLLKYVDGNLVDRKVGAITAQQLASFVGV